jgi:altronate hydrolase
MAAPSKTLCLHPLDNVRVALEDLAAGERLEREGIVCRGCVPAGHKLAAAAIRAGAAVVKYGQPIGTATCEIAAGDHVHTHNLGMGRFVRDYASGVEAGSAAAGADPPEFFQGILRPDGRVATRNYIGVISTVNCSASVARMVADRFRGEALGDYPNVDGVVPICHGFGCGMAGSGRGFDHLRESLAGYSRHPNFAAVLLIGLGCEVMQVGAVAAEADCTQPPMVTTLTIQETGGTRRTVEEAAARVRAMLPAANAVRREPVPAGRLVLGLECGGSDALSGITANPVLGAAVDRLVAQGGTAILGETPEIYGAEHLLTRRAANREVAEKLIGCIRWWEEYTARLGGEMDNNPTPGNKAGGLTTILEKSLGAVAKGGTTALKAVYRYAEAVTERGLVFMDTPGYDPVSITGMVAGGANLICFTTGRGSVYGCRPAPSLKLATNTPMYRRMAEDMDLDCGPIAEGRASVDELGRALFRLILDTASGRRTKSELLGIGNDEFVPWQIGAVM